MTRYIFGAGIQGKAFYDVMQAQGMEVTGFLDHFSTKESYLGHPVLKPEAVSDKTAEILISVGLVSHKIKEKLEKDGFTQCLDYTQSVLKYPEILQELKVKSMWYHPQLSKRVDRPKLDQVRALLVDEKSKQLLDQIARFRTNFKKDDYIVPDLHETQYFPSDIDVFQGLDRLRFVDAGAYTGDTVQSLSQSARKKNVEIESLVCFEPDSDNLTRLNQRAHDLDLDHGVYIYPAGVWSETRILSFQGGSASSSSINEDVGDQSIQGIRLDECLYHMAPNFIKMDVEGAELEALWGAENIIRTFQPVLAICLYHKPLHLWEIPLYIHTLAPTYNMYLRVYGDMLLETVLYCLPKR